MLCECDPEKHGLYMPPHLKSPAKPSHKIESTAEDFFFITYPSPALQGSQAGSRRSSSSTHFHQLHLTPLGGGAVNLFDGRMIYMLPRRFRQAIDGVHRGSKHYSSSGTNGIVSSLTTLVLKSCSCNSITRNPGGSKSKRICSVCGTN